MRSSTVYKNELLLAQVVADSYSLGECLRRLGLSFTGNSRVKLRAAIAEFGLNTTHFRPNGRSFEAKARSAKSLADHLVLGSTITSSALKRKLWAQGVLPRVCQECGQDEAWNGKKLVLQLDHINGNRRDNRIENLRIVCPNCHTQTHTFAGRGRKSASAVCAPVPLVDATLRDKVSWPSNKHLLELVWSRPLSTLSVELGVSDTAIRKRCKKLGLALPPFGHWQREAAKKCIKSIGESPSLA